MPSFGGITRRIKVIIDSEELEILVRRIDQAMKVKKYCDYCRKHLFHAEHQDDSKNSFYLCESCNTPN